MYLCVYFEDNFSIVLEIWTSFFLFVCCWLVGMHISRWFNLCYNRWNFFQIFSSLGQSPSELLVSVERYMLMLASCFLLVLLLNVTPVSPSDNTANIKWKFSFTKFHKTFYTALGLMIITYLSILSIFTVAVADLWDFVHKKAFFTCTSITRVCFDQTS